MDLEVSVIRGGSKLPYMDPFDPQDAAKDLEEHGIRCELPSSRGTILGNRGE